MPSRIKALVAKPFIKAGISIAFKIGQIGLRIPQARDRLIRKFAIINRMGEEEAAETLFSKEMQETLVKCELIYLLKEVKKGKRIKTEYKAFQMTQHNDQVEESGNVESGYTEIWLTDIQRPGVPLVLNFGSNSWPPFNVDSKSFLKLKNQYEGQMDFAYVYIEEAHPTGEWIFKVRR